MSASDASILMPFPELKKPFTAPTTSTPLRFRYTSYLGDSHPASRKVVLEFKPSELPGLNESQTIKLIKLAGTRYNPEKQLIKMSSESFETPAQNKRYLGDLIQKLVKEAKDGKDTLEDIPVDLRHHKQKPIYKFPEEWKIERPARIEQGKRLRGKGGRKRQVVQRLEQAGQLVDGERVVREAMAAVPVARLGRADGQKTVLGTRSGKAPVKGKQTTPTSW
jgi:small subunit ribosomal protein S35